MYFIVLFLILHLFCDCLDKEEDKSNKDDHV